MKYTAWCSQFKDAFTIDSIRLFLDDPFVCEADKWFISKTLETTVELDDFQREELGRIEVRRRNSEIQQIQRAQNRAVKRKVKKQEAKVAAFVGSKQSQECFICTTEQDEYFHYHTRKKQAGSGDIIPVCDHCYPVLMDLNSKVPHDTYRNLRKWAKPILTTTEKSKVAACAAAELSKIWKV